MDLTRAKTILILAFCFSTPIWGTRCGISQKYSVLSYVSPQRRSKKSWVSWLNKITRSQQRCHGKFKP
jgi:hypothetical protein